ncbi:MAG TPA: hypothetical protein VIH99_14155, partial [Bdellovibrionota bacterium]
SACLKQGGRVITDRRYFVCEGGRYDGYITSGPASKVNAKECPNINGTYSLRMESGETALLTLYTRRAGEEVNYGPVLPNTEIYFPADGVARDVSQDGVSGQVSFRCVKKSLEMLANIDGKGSTKLRMTLVDAKHLKVTSSNPNLGFSGGIYELVEGEPLN